MTDAPIPTTPRPSDEAARRAVRNAWISVIAIPVAFLVAIFVGEALAGLLGYDAGGQERAPLGVLLGAGLPAVFVMIAPTIPAMVFGFRARRLGRTEGLIAAIIGIVAAAWAIVSNALPLLIGA
ncbi:hypothetical protein [Agromyces bauzanensis]